MSFFMFQLVLFLIICFLLILLSWIWPPNSPWAPWWRTSKKLAWAVCTFAKVKRNDVIYELGSGEGNVLIIAAKKYGVRCVGIEIEPVRAWLSRIDIWIRGLSNHIRIIRGDLFKQDISEASIIFVYLVPKTLKKLKKKFLKELQPGTKIVSLRYEIDGWNYSEFDKKNQLYLYKVPRS